MIDLLKISRQICIIGLAALLLSACSNTRVPKEPTNSVSLLNANEMNNWSSVNTPSDSWQWEQDELQTRGDGLGYLRSPNAYNNYTISFDAIAESKSAGGLLLAATALPEKSSPYPAGVHIPIASGNWTAYQIEVIDGKIRVFENRKLIQTVDSTRNRSGFICLLKDGVSIKYKNFKFSGASSPQEGISSLTEMDKRFQPLYTGADLNQWNMKPGHLDHWTAKGWVIDYDGLSKERDKCLWTKKSYRDFELLADVRLTRKPTAEWSPVVLPNGDNALNEDGTNKQVLELYAGDTGIYLRGDSKNQINIGYRYLGSGEIYGYRVDKKMPAEVRAGVTPKIKADNFPGQWNRFFIRLVQDRLTVVLNGITVIDNALLPGIAPEGPIALQDDHASNNTFQFANLFIREL